MAKAHPNLAAELARIDAFHADQLNSIEISISEIAHLLSSKSLRQAAQMLVEESQNGLGKSWLRTPQNDLVGIAGQALFRGLRSGNARNSLEATTFQRTLASMSEPERAAVRLADVLQALGRFSADDRLRAVVPMVWNKGDTLIAIGGSHGGSFRGQDAARHILKDLVTSTFGDSNSGRERVQAALRAALDQASGLPSSMRSVLERYLVAGSRWLTELEAAIAMAPNGDSPSALRLGTVAGTATELLFDLNESLITIAPPGAGKSQAHVLRNLLNLDAPAVVLDIKGEMHEASAKWRGTHVGPVFVFDPKNTNESLSYNPLDLISTDPETAWDDARRLADLLVVPPATSRADDYFEGRGRDMITTAILDVALSETGELRAMRSVLDRLYLSEGDKLADWFEHLDTLEVPQLRRQASALKGMPAKQREGILDSARRQLEIWQSPAIERLTTSSTFSAATLRTDKATLYLRVALDDVKKFASVLRVIIGQTVHALCRIKPESGARPVTFFLDELPRLGRIDVIEEALDIGRSYGVRLWLFCQNTGQLATAYPNAEGMIGNCAARFYMNPDEETARQLSRNLGMREGLLDGQRKPLAEAPQLTGPEFANQAIAFLRKNAPARLDKRPAHADPLCRERMAGFGPPLTPPPQPVEPAPPDATIVPAAPPIAPAADAASNALPAAAPAAAILPRPANPNIRRWLIPVAVTAVAVIWTGFLVADDRNLRAREQTLHTRALAIEDGQRRAQNELAAQRRGDGVERANLQREINSLRSGLQASEIRAQAAEQLLAAERQARLQAERNLLDARAYIPPPTAPTGQPPAPTAQRAPSSPAADHPAIAECDRLAGNPSDPRRSTSIPPVPYSQLRQHANLAIAACERAADSAPREPRMRYQLGRALQAANRDTPALEVLREAAAQNYPAAFDNIGNLHLKKQQYAEAVAAFRGGVAAGDPDAMVSLATMIEQGHTRPRHADEIVALLIEAAKRGHTGARAAVERRRAEGSSIPWHLLQEFMRFVTTN